MSQNKTKFPGMENTGNNPYKRDSFDPDGDVVQYRGKGKQTKYPEMEFGGVEETKTEEQHDPIVGFLFSVSRTPFGEFWPLYVGKNMIGRDNENAVCLMEGSVSGEHAALVVEQLTNPNETVAVLENKGSKNGTFINGKRLIYGRTEECKNGDILRFGSSYECLLIIFDVRELGLKKAENFISVDSDEEVEEFDIDGPYRRGNETRPGGDQFMNNNATPKGTTPLDGGPVFGGPKHKTEAM